MNSLPDQEPDQQPEPTPDHASPLSDEFAAPPHSSDPAPSEEYFPEPSPLASTFAVFDNPFLDMETPETQPEPATAQPPSPEQPLFQSWYRPEPPPTIRIPHFGHLAMLGLLILFAWMCAGTLTLIAIKLHLYGVSTIQAAILDIHYTIGSMAILYIVTFSGCLIVFPLFWHKSLFAGLQWNFATAFRLRNRLFGAAFLCFLLALLNGLLLPGPKNAPIDKIIRAPGAAWILFAFGVTFAPFFEEMAFRGFILPALCTAWDWAVERSTGRPVRPLGVNGHPQWSLFAMIVGSIFTSLPFAAMHAAQTGYSIGPFILLVTVSLVLCWARLSTKSLAASVLVHASYNFLLFSIMMLGTQGFRNLDKL